MAVTGTSIAGIVVVRFDAPRDGRRGDVTWHDAGHAVVEAARRFRPVDSGPHGPAGTRLLFSCASSALGAAAAAQRAVRAQASPVDTRVGISAGDVTWHDGRIDGAALAIAAALADRADRGEILVSDVVRLLLDPGPATLTPRGSIAVDGVPIETYSAAWEPAERARPAPGAVVPHAAGDGHLSEREAEVLRFVATGLGNRAIGERLFISQNTVANHVRAILTKTGCANRTEATMFAVRHGMIDER